MNSPLAAAQALIAQFTPEERQALAPAPRARERRSVIVPVRFSPYERALLARRASDAGLSVSQYVRQRVLAE